jgi:hypothetical protein
MQSYIMNKILNNRLIQLLEYFRSIIDFIYFLCNCFPNEIEDLAIPVEIYSFCLILIIEDYQENINPES